MKHEYVDAGEICAAVDELRSRIEAAEGALNVPAIAIYERRIEIASLNAMAAEAIIYSLGGILAKETSEPPVTSVLFAKYRNRIARIVERIKQLEEHPAQSDDQ